MKTMPLKGITIIDFGHVMAGPYGTKQLLGMGATVIKVESKKHSDNFRYSYMRAGNKDLLNEGGWIFQENNTSKMALGLNTKSVKAQEILHKLVKKADVVTANLSPSGFHKMGIDYETLSRIKEDIIVINASGMGDYGPYSAYRTAAPIMQALSGFSSLIGYDGEEPFGFGAALSDYVGGAYIAAAVTAALEYRRRTGKGQFIDLSSTDASICTIGAEALNYSVTREETVPFGNHHYRRQMAPHNCYPCKGQDSWCTIAVGNDEEWKAFRNELRSECPWVDDEKFATLPDRLHNEDLLDEYISEWTKNLDKKEVAERLQKAGVSAGMVENSKEFLENEHANAVGFFKDIQFDVSGFKPEHAKITGRVIDMRDVPEIKYGLAPRAGQDNDYILKEMLGMSDEEIEDAAADGAFN